MKINIWFDKISNHIFPRGVNRSAVFRQTIWCPEMPPQFHSCLVKCFFFHMSMSPLVDYFKDSKLEAVKVSRPCEVKQSWYGCQTTHCSMQQATQWAMEFFDCQMTWFRIALLQQANTNLLSTCRDLIRSLNIKTKTRNKQLRDHEQSQLIP